MVGGEDRWVRILKERSRVGLKDMPLFECRLA